MLPKSWIAVILLSLLGAWRSFADAPKPDFAAELAQQRREIRISAEGISGPGAELLLHEAAQARFVLIGEEHGLIEVSELATAIYQEASPPFTVYGAEVGILAAEQIVAMAKDPRGMTAFDEFQRAFPFAFPFATFREDAGLMARAARQGTFVGLDQEFLLAPAWLLGEIYTELREVDRELAAEAAQALAAEQEAYRLRNEKRDPEAAEIFLNLPLPAGWERWKTALEGRPRALRAMRSLEESQQIYSLYHQGRYHDNNDQRGKVMKAHWVAATRPLGGPALPGGRAIFRLGANHVIRGMSPLGISDIGNFLAELAASDGASSLHVLVLPTSGAMNAWVPFLPNELQAYKIDVLSDDYSFYHDLLAALPKDGGRAVYDLRPLRAKHRRLSTGKPNLEKILTGYDLVVLVDQARPTTLLPSLAALGAPAAAPAPPP